MKQIAVKLSNLKLVVAWLICKVGVSLPFVHIDSFQHCCDDVQAEEKEGRMSPASHNKSLLAECLISCPWQRVWCVEWLVVRRDRLFLRLRG